jgi:hypothetical protein
LITLIVFDVQKKELKRDLAIVVVIQIAALLYGVSVLFIARPVFIVFNADRFDVVYANEITKDALLQVKHKQFKSMPYFGPKIVGARFPDDINITKKIISDAVSGGNDIQQMPQFYVRYEDMLIERKRAIRPLEELKAYNKNKISSVETLINHFTSVSDKFGYIPLKAKVRDLSVIVNSNSLDIEEMSKLMPLDNSYGVNGIDVKSLIKKGEK